MADSASESFLAAKSPRLPVTPAVGPPKTEKVPMNDSWNKHIQPILDSWQWDNFSWVWEPFLEKYPNFNVEQQTLVENAIAITAFDTNDEKLAIKALSIAETLYTSHLATQRLSELIRDGLREKVRILKIESAATSYYITASSFFGVTESIPYIRSVIEQIEKMKTESNLDENSAQWQSYQGLLQVCSAALLRLEPYTPSQERQNAEQMSKNLRSNLSGK
jgi:hypothetical protein